MINLMEEIRQQVRTAVDLALKKSVNKGELPEIDMTGILIESPKEKEHGEFSTNIAMQITKQAKKPPRQIADIIIKNLEVQDTYIEEVEVAGPGFINFHLNPKWLYRAIRIIQKEKQDYGRLNLGAGQKVMVEFVSANPTGTLHMGNARGGALGDCIASVLEAAGYDVTREYYVNDAGNQIEKFGISLEVRYIQLIKGEDAVEFPEDGYHVKSRPIPK